MADRGFFISNELKKQGAVLNILCFPTSRYKLIAAEIKENIYLSKMAPSKSQLIKVTDPQREIPVKLLRNIWISSCKYNALRSDNYDGLWQNDIMAVYNISSGWVSSIRCFWHIFIQLFFGRTNRCISWFIF